jgi:hypothetical protein
MDKRVQFDFAIEFSNGGGLQGQGFRLDIPGDTISDHELADYLVRDMRLLMVGKVQILNKQIISEQHKRKPVNKQPERNLLSDLSHTLEQKEEVSMTERSELIATLQQTHSRLVDLTATLSDRALDYRLAPDEWTIREILAHLVDDEMFVMRTRLERIVKEELPTLVPNDEKQWHSERNTSRDQMGELLHDFAIQRAASLNILTFLRDSDWTRQAYHPETGHLTTQTWVEHWAEHDTVHIAQIKRIIASWQATAE